MLNSRYSFHSKFSDRNLDYANQYFDLVNDFYSQWSLTPIKVSYYNLDIENSTIDKSKLDSGSYQMVGKLSGWKWRKILEFPIYGPQQINTTPTNDERGTTQSEKLVDAYFPRTSGLVPKVHDLISFDQFNKNNRFILNDPPLYEVVNVEKSNDFELAFYKINCKVSYIIKSQIDMQLTDIIDFIDYEKRMYSIDDALNINKLLSEREKLKLDVIFDQKIGLYCETISI